MAAGVEVGAILGGRYRVEAILGAGGMGAVYRASDTRLSTLWAIKEMTDCFEDAEEREAAAAAFQQEANILATLQHRNMPRVIDSFEQGGRRYLVMDLVQGEDLQKVLLRQGRLTVPQVVDMALQVLDCLRYLHERPSPIIFRDIKPANIIIGHNQPVKLIDFGIARFFKSGRRSDTQALGTPGYAAPEQYGSGQSDARTDIYALSATMHHCLSGVEPGQELFKFASLQTLVPGISLELSQIVEQGLEVDPKKRFQSAGAMFRALKFVEQDLVGSPAPRPRPSVSLSTPAVPGPAPTVPGPVPTVPRPAPAVPGSASATTGGVRVVAPKLAYAFPDRVVEQVWPREVPAGHEIVKNKYKLVHNIMRFKQTALYRAIDSVGYPYYVQVIAQSCANPEVRRSQLERFNQTLKLLYNQGRHKYIPPIVEWFSLGQMHYVVFAGATCLPYGAVMKSMRQTRQGFANAAIMLRQISGALLFLEQLGVPDIRYVRNLSCGSILALSPTEYQLIDLGLVNIFYPQLTGFREWSDGRYMAPEVYERGRFDSASAVFSLGAIAHHALSDNQPRPCQKKYFPLHVFSQQAPEELERLLTTALQPRPSERFSNLKHFRDRLRPIATALTEESYS